MNRTIKLAQEEPEDLGYLVGELQKAKAGLAMVEEKAKPYREAIADLQARITGAMIDNRTKRFEIDSYTEGKKFRVTYVAQHRTKYDEEGIEKAIGKRAFNKYTVRKFDPKLFQDGLSTEALDVSAMEPFIKTTTTQSIRTYEVDPEEFDEGGDDA